MAEPVKNSPRLGCIRSVGRCVQVFGGLLLLGGVLSFEGPAVYVRDALQMRNWEPAPAVILKAELKAEQEDSNQFAQATYQYEYHGVEHVGHRIDAAGGSMLAALPDQNRIAADLEKLQQDATPTTCYVNRADPAESVLNPQLSYTVLALSLLGPTLFSVTGLVMFGAPSKALRRLSHLVQRQRAHPDEPWLWREDWAAQRIRTDSYGYAWVLLMVAVLYLLVVLPLSLLVLVDRGSAVLSVPGVILILVGWGFLNSTRQLLKSSRKWKHAELRLGAPHGLIGGSFAGVVEIPVSTPPDATFQVRLECQESKKDSAGESSQSTVWRNESRVQQTNSAAGTNSTVIPIYFAIPMTCKSTDAGYLQNIRWRLTVEADSRDKNQAMFEVPVFKTKASSSGYQFDPTILEPYQPIEDGQQTIEKHCRVQPLPSGGEELQFSYVERLNLAVSVGWIGALVAAITALLHFGFHVGWTIVPAVLAAIFILVTLETMLWGSRIEIHRDEIKVAAGMTGFRKSWTLSREQFTGCATLETSKESLRENNDSYRIRLTIQPAVAGAGQSVTAGDDNMDAETDQDVDDDELKDDDLEVTPLQRTSEHLIIVKQIKTRQQAESLAEWLREKLGIRRGVVKSE